LAKQNKQQTQKQKQKQKKRKNTEVQWGLEKPWLEWYWHIYYY
jgi:hypothetical protein